MACTTGCSLREGSFHTRFRSTPARLRGQEGKGGKSLDELTHRLVLKCPQARDGDANARLAAVGSLHT